MSATALVQIPSSSGKNFGDSMFSVVAMGYFALRSMVVDLQPVLAANVALGNKLSTSAGVAGRMEHNPVDNHFVCTPQCLDHFIPVRNFQHACLVRCPTQPHWSV